MPITLAATFLLIFRPESVLTPSFQMSFAAVLGLCAYFRKRPDHTPLYHSGAYRIFGYGRDIAMSSVVAGLATAPFALYHFGQYAVLGLLANMLAMPLASFLIMPAGVLAVLVMPLGLENIPLELMAIGIEAMLWVSHTVSDLPLATLRLPHMEPIPLIIITLGGLWICFQPRKQNWLGLIPIMIGTLLYGLQSLPDVILDERGQQFAIYDAERGMLMPNRVRSRYARKYWTKALGLEHATRFSELPQTHPLSSCTDESCLWNHEGVSFYRGSECQKVDVLILTSRQNCRGTIATITSNDLRDNGAHTLWVEDGNVTIRSVEPERGARRWTASTN